MLTLPKPESFSKPQFESFTKSCQLIGATLLGVAVCLMSASMSRDAASVAVAPIFVLLPLGTVLFIGGILASGIYQSSLQNRYKDALQRCIQTLPREDLTSVITAVGDPSLTSKQREDLLEALTAAHPGWETAQ